MADHNARVQEGILVIGETVVHCIVFERLQNNPCRIAECEIVRPRTFVFSLWDCWVVIINIGSSWKILGLWSNSVNCFGLVGFNEIVNF